MHLCARVQAQEYCSCVCKCICAWETCQKPTPALSHFLSQTPALFVSQALLPLTSLELTDLARMSGHQSACPCLPNAGITMYASLWRIYNFLVCACRMDAYVENRGPLCEVGSLFPLYMGSGYGVWFGSLHGKCVFSHWAILMVHAYYFYMDFGDWTRVLSLARQLLHEPFPSPERWILIVDFRLQEKKNTRRDETMELQQTRHSTAETEEAQEGKSRREWKQGVTGEGDRTGYLPLSSLVWLRLAHSYYVLCPQTLTMSSSPLGSFPHPYLTSHLCVLHLTPS